MRWILEEAGERRELTVTGRALTVGRAPDNDVVARDGRVSRHHSRIERRGDGVRVLDLGSANGTRLNGQQVREATVRPGDCVAVGELLLTLESVEAEPSEAFDTLSEGTRSEARDLRAFVALASRMVAETDLKGLLVQVVDCAVELVGAERGFLLLGPDRREVRPSSSAELEVRVARSFDRSEVLAPRGHLSAGIVGRVLADGGALLSLDAGEDSRLGGMASVEELRLRSVLCVPVPGETGPQGVLYLDNRLQRGAFEQRELELVELLAVQAAVALRNARLVAALREQNQELEVSRLAIQRLNEQLGRTVRDQEGQLAVTQAQLGRERGRQEFAGIVGSSDAMRAVFDQLERIVETELPVLVHGESGTGKELIARAIHRAGARRQRPFITENVGALPDSLLESELFGHVKGAFTGAYKAKRGLLEQADGGTLFLDEVGDMSPAMQKKLLRVLQEGEVRPVGSDEVRRVDVRVVAASNRDLEELVRDGVFREDLFYRLAVLRVDLPPLRARRDDIPLLAETLLSRAAREAGRAAPVLTHEVLAALMRHSWPGNVRELENEMRRLVVLAEGGARLADLSASVLEARPIAGASDEVQVLEAGDIKGAVADLERRSIEAALEQASGNKSQAARSLGISRFALQRKLEKYGLSS
ncbi:MAG: sigma 54-interacting transcriptional regulator [Planctomycetes bacterium]|nr:sigma 54-interacting transcriptional regulator [Planctomycetota bacterium]MDA0947760.1 sigma 54-interacting transcriptional regulator [Planctomycetota bacterium]